MSTTSEWSVLSRLLLIFQKQLWVNPGRKVTVKGDRQLEGSWNKIISLGIIESMKNSWQHNDSSKFLPNFHQFKINFEFTYLAIRNDMFNMRALNNDSVKSLHDRCAVKPSKHSSNIKTRFMPFLFIQLLVNFHWQRFCFCKTWRNLVFWNLRCLLFIDKSPTVNFNWICSLSNNLNLLSFSFCFLSCVFPSWIFSVLLFPSYAFLLALSFSVSLSVCFCQPLSLPPFLPCFDFVLLSSFLSLFHFWTRNSLKWRLGYC